MCWLRAKKKKALVPVECVWKQTLAIQTEVFFANQAVKMFIPAAKIYFFQCCWLGVDMVSSTATVSLKWTTKKLQH